MTLHLSASVADALLVVLVVLSVAALAGVVGLLSGRIQIQVEDEAVEQIATSPKARQQFGGSDG